MKYVERREDIVWAFAGLVSVVCLAAWLGHASGEQMLGMGLMMVMVAAVVKVMSELTVRSTVNEVCVSLGAGLSTRRIPREAILDVRLVPSPSPFAVGLRLLPGGWLYSLGPRELFVELALADGSSIFIGAANAVQLAEQIQSPDDTINSS